MRRRQALVLFYFCTAIGTLLVLAASLPLLSFRPGRSFILYGEQSAAEAADAAPPSLGDLGYWRVLIVAIVLAMLGYFVLALIFSPRLRWQLLRRLVRSMVILFLVYLLASRLAHVLPQLALAPTNGAPRSQSQAAAGEPLPPFVAQTSPWLAAIVGLLLIAMLLAGIWYFWRRGQPAAHPVTALAQEAIESIQAGGDVQSIVLRCYLEMSEVLSEQSGVTRQRAMTPREFERQLAGAGVSDAHIRQLTRLFEGARYGAQAPSARDERAAIECLAAIVRAYGGAA